MTPEEKFHIVTDGDQFKVQEYRWWSWRDCPPAGRRTSFGEFSGVGVYDSLSDAEAALKDLAGREKEKRRAKSAEWVEVHRPQQSLKSVNMPLEELRSTLQKMGEIDWTLPPSDGNERGKFYSMETNKWGTLEEHRLDRLQTDLKKLDIIPKEVIDPNQDSSP